MNKSALRWQRLSALTLVTHVTAAVVAIGQATSYVPNANPPDNPVGTAEQIYVGASTPYANVNTVISDEWAAGNTHSSVEVHLDPSMCTNDYTTPNTIDAAGGTTPYVVTGDPFSNTHGVAITALYLPACPPGYAVFTNSPLHTSNSQKIWGSGSGGQAVNTGSTIRPGQSFPPPVPPYTGTVTVQDVATGNMGMYSGTTCPGSSLTAGYYNVGLTWLTATNSTDMPLQPPSWQPNTYYGVGLSYFAYDGSNVERPVQAGTSGGTAPTWIASQTQQLTSITSISESGNTVTVRTTSLPATFVNNAWIVVTGFTNSVGVNATGYNVQGAQISVTGTNFTYTVSPTGLSSLTGSSSNVGSFYTVTNDNGVLWVNMGPYYQTPALVNLAHNGDCIDVQKPTGTGIPPSGAAAFEAFGQKQGASLPYLSGGKAALISASGVMVTSSFQGAPPPAVNLSCALQVNGSPDNYANPIEVGDWNQHYLLDVQGLGYTFTRWVIGEGCAAAISTNSQENAGFWDVGFVNASGPAAYVAEGFNGRNSESSNTEHDFIPPTNCSVTNQCNFSGSTPVFPTYAAALDDMVIQMHCFFCQSDFAIGDDYPPPLGLLMEEFLAPSQPTVANSVSEAYTFKQHFEAEAANSSTYEAVPLGVQDDGMSLSDYTTDDRMTGSASVIHNAITLNNTPAGNVGGSIISAVNTAPPANNVRAINDTVNGHQSAVGAIQGLYVLKSAGGIAVDTENAPPTGTGANGEVTYWSGVNTLTGSSGFSFNSGTGALAVPGSGSFSGELSVTPPSGTATALAITPSANSTTTLNVENSSGSSVLSVDTTNSLPQEKLFDLCSAVDFSCNQTRENWMTGAVTLSANIGNLGWTRTTVTGGSSTSFMPTGSFPDMGGIEIVTPATSGDGQSWALTQGIPGLLGTTNDIWFLKLRFQQPQGTTDSTNGEIFQIGVTASGGLSSTNSAGFAALQLDIDTTITRGSWWVGPCSGSACILDNYASVDNNWHTLQIFSLTAGNISFQLDSSAAVCFTAASSGPCNGITGSNVTYNAGTYLPSTSAVLLPFVKDVAESSTAVKAIQGRWAFEIKDLTGTGLP